MHLQFLVEDISGEVLIDKVMTKHKIEWAGKIGACLDLDSNKSPSFQFFLKEVRKRLEIGA